MKCLSKDYTYSNVVILKALIERDDVLIGFDSLGLPMYQTKTVYMTFYGITAHECLKQLKCELNRPKMVVRDKLYDRSLKFI